ncbi:transketolase family protein [Candidatus Harpocratesius sp.]
MDKLSYSLPSKEQNMKKNKLNSPHIPFTALSYNKINEILGINNNTKKMSLREAFGKSLAYFGGICNLIVVLDGDLSQSTKTHYFAQKYPERFFNIGIAEQDIVSIAAGLASCGKIAVACTYATFLVGRALDQIRNMVAFNKLNVKLIGAHAGLATGEDGATHQALEDLAIMRAIPNIKIFTPSDAFEVVNIMKYALFIDSPVYIRISRPEINILTDKSENFTINKIRIKNTINNPVCALIGHGTIVNLMTEVSNQLKKHNIEALVISVHTLKPFDIESIKDLNSKVSIFFSFEDHNVIGGLGSAIADVLSELPNSKKLVRFGIHDKFGTSGSIEDLYEFYGLTSNQIVKRILKEIN